MDGMSLLGWLSGSPNKQAVSTSWSDTNLLIDYHERAELATSVIKLRMSRALVAQGVPRADADAIVAQKIRKEVSNETIALSTPDGAIIQIVETYLYGI